jgi:3'-5' exonuclease
MTPTLVFDIETIPDAKGLRKLHDLDDAATDVAVAEFAMQRRRQATGGDFLPLQQHRVLVISCLLRTDEGVRVFSIGDGKDDEGTVIQRFFDGVERYTPQLVSWNGGGFDLPVLHYRGMIHRVRAPRYWDQGDDDRDFKWNNYISRYHARHIDLMDLLALFQGRAAAPLDEIAQLCGFPGKLGMDGSMVWQAFLDGKVAEIRNYCETDVMNTYLVFLRFQLMRGTLTPERHDEEIAFLRDYLGTQDAPHWKEFLAAWNAG